MTKMARSLVFLVGLLLSACGGEDEKCGTKPGGAECFDGSECQSCYCYATTRECQGTADEKPEGPSVGMLSTAEGSPPVAESRAGDR